MGIDELELPPASHRLPYCYRLHGLTIASEIELPQLEPRRVDEIASADIRIRRGELPDPAKGRPTDVPYVHLWGSGALMYFPDLGRYLIEDGREVVVDASRDAEPAVVRLFILGSVMGMACHQRGLMALHASAVAFDDQVVAFMGWQGAGKSTLAAHCLAAGARLVSDDLLVVTLGRDGRAHAHPGVPALKLWGNALEALGRTSEGLPRDWWREDKYHVSCSRAVETPLDLRHVLLLDEDETTGDGTLTPLNGAQSIRALVANTYRVEYLDIAGRRDRHFRDCALLASNVPVSRLGRRRDPQRLSATVELVAAVIRKAP